MNTEKFNRRWTGFTQMEERKILNPILLICVNPVHLRLKELLIQMSMRGR